MKQRRIEVIEPYISDGAKASVREARYWNILEKLAKLRSSDETLCGSRPLIPGHEGGERRWWFQSNSHGVSEMAFQSKNEFSVIRIR
jgi:hypothetical protein